MGRAIWHRDRDATNNELDNVVVLDEAEQRVMKHGMTPGCPLCAEAVLSLQDKGLVPANVVPLSRDDHRKLHSET